MWGSDNGSVLIAVAPLVEDKRFRAIRDPNVHDAVTRTIAPFRPWLDVLQPTSGVYVMGGLHNTLRRLVVDGAPVATGLAAVGDSVCTTNPTFGRGLALALQGAVDLVAALAESDGLKLALRLDGDVRAHIEPYYRDQARNDSDRLAGLRHNLTGGRPARIQPAEHWTNFAEIRAAMPFDPQVFRAFWRVMNMLCPPEEVYRDAEVVRLTRAALASSNGTTSTPQPERADIEAALGLG